MAELRSGKSVFKAGKLIKVFVEFDDEKGIGKITKITIAGDFFMHPEEKIGAIEEGLVGTPIDEKKIQEKLEELLEGVKVFGFDAAQLTQAIMAACKNGA